VLLLFIEAVCMRYYPSSRDEGEKYYMQNGRYVCMCLCLYVLELVCAYLHTLADPDTRLPGRTSMQTFG